VGANHRNGVAGLPFFADGECDDGRCVASEVVFATRLEGGCPRVSFLWGEGWHKSDSNETTRCECTLICLNPAFSKRSLADLTAWKAGASYYMQVS
jgi:hypothetical protein